MTKNKQNQSLILIITIIIIKIITNYTHNKQKYIWQKISKTKNDTNNNNNINNIKNNNKLYT